MNGDKIMKVPFIDLNRINDKVQVEVNNTIKDIIHQKNFISGERVKHFETQFSAITRIPYVVACSSGTMALYTCGRVLDLKEEDEVIFPVYTAIESIFPFVQLGIKPVFVDIDPVTYTMDTNKIKQAITEKTTAIVCVHLYGNTCNMNAIMNIAEENNLYVIEDCSQAHLARYKGKDVGSFGHISAYSFNPTGNLGAYGEAGAVVTNNPEVYEKIKLFIDNGKVGKYEYNSLGLNLKMDELQGAVLGVKIRYLQKWVTMRRNHARIYENNFLKFSEVSTPKVQFNSSHAYHLYPIQIKFRDEVRTHLQKNGIDTGKHYHIPLHLQKAFEYLGYKEGDFPVAETLAKHIITLPMYPELRLDEINYIVEKIGEII